MEWKSASGMRLVAAALALCLTAACSAAPTCPGGSRVTRPDETLVLKAINHGQSGRDLAAAIFAGERGEAARLLASDPTLRTTHVPPVEYPNFAPDGQYGDLLTFAVARCDAAMLDTLLDHGVAATGTIQRSALDLAIRSGTLDLAERLLKAGAKPDAIPGDRIVPMLSAGRTANPQAARLLLRYHADPNWRDATHTTILQSVVDMDAMQVAEALIEGGADPWAVSAGGALPARGIYEPLRLTSALEEAARTRLIARLKKPFAPWPPPDAQTVSAAIKAGQWPPQGSNLPPAPPEVTNALR